MDASHHRDLSSLKTQLRHGLAPSTEQIIRGDITLQVIFSRLQNANNTNIVTSLTLPRVNCKILFEEQI